MTVRTDGKTNGVGTGRAESTEAYSNLSFTQLMLYKYEARHTTDR
jgi:hypothetical protein